MNRRGFLARAFTVATLASAPAWLRNAWAGDKDEIAVLSAAFQRAVSGRRALLVLVIPEGAEIWDRGHALGEWINHGPVDDFALLGQLEVACARMEALERLVPTAATRGGSEPWMVLVQTDAVPARVWTTRVSLPRPEPDTSASEPQDPREHWRRREEAENRLIDARIEAISAAFRSLVRPVLGTVEQLDPDRRAALVKEALDRLRTKPPSGARWAHSGGCGTTYEDEKERIISISCGMGHTPERSSRFLSFHVEY